MTQKLEIYEKERRLVAKKNLQTAMKYYQQSLKIAASVGFNLENLNFLKSVSEKLNPVSSYLGKTLFDTGIKIGSYPVET